MQRLRFAPLTLSLTTVLAVSACGEDERDDGAAEVGETSGDDDLGDGDSGDGDSGDTDSGDGDATSGDGDGDGDGDSTTEGDTSTDGTTDDTTTGDTGVSCDNDPGWGPLVEGEFAKHIQGFDQTGAEFNMCEYAGTPIIIDVAAVWCGPCNVVSDYFAHDGADPFGGGLGPQLKALIDAGTVIWMTTLVEDANGGAATVANANAWDQQYPHPNIPVVVQGDISMLPTYFNLGCWPSAFIVDHEMKWMGFDDCVTWNQLVEVVQTYGG